MCTSVQTWERGTTIGVPILKSETRYWYEDGMRGDDASPCSQRRKGLSIMTLRPFSYQCACFFGIFAFTPLMGVARGVASFLIRIWTTTCWGSNWIWKLVRPRLERLLFAWNKQFGGFKWNLDNLWNVCFVGEKTAICTHVRPFGQRPKKGRIGCCCCFTPIKLHFKGWFKLSLELPKCDLPWVGRLGSKELGSNWKCLAGLEQSG